MSAAKDSSARRMAAPPAGPRVVGRFRLRRRHVLLTALVPVLVVLWVPMLRGRSGKSAAAATGPAAALPAAPGGEGSLPVSPPGTPAAAAALGERLRRLLAPPATRWSQGAGGGPFAPDGMVPGPREDVSGDRRFAPTAIVLSQSEPPIAIIGGQTCRLGDLVAGRRIVAIEERRVVYRDGDTNHAFSIPPPTLGGEHVHDR